MWVANDLFKRIVHLSDQQTMHNLQFIKLDLFILHFRRFCYISKETFFSCIGEYCSTDITINPEKTTQQNLMKRLQIFLILLEGTHFTKKMENLSLLLASMPSQPKQTLFQPMASSVWEQNIDNERLSFWSPEEVVFNTASHWYHQFLPRSILCSMAGSSLITLVFESDHAAV